MTDEQIKRALNRMASHIHASPDAVESIHSKRQRRARQKIAAFGGVGVLAVAGLVAGLIATSGTTSRGTPVTSSGTPPCALRIFSGGAGWALANGRLEFTADGGRGWADRTPANVPAPTPHPGEAACAVGAPYLYDVLDAKHVWISFAASPTQAMVLWTGDAGLTWQSSSLALDSGSTPSVPNTGSIPVYLRFLDSQHGWVEVTTPGGDRFAPGQLVVTDDGGQTWTQVTAEMPTRAPIAFVTPLVGWAVGGPSGRDIFSTRDGGHSWQSVSLKAPPGGAPGSDLQLQSAAPPIFADSVHGILPAYFADAKSVMTDDVIVVYVTSDGGSSWSPTAPNLVAGSGVIEDDQFSVLDASSWIFSNGGKLYSTTDAGSSWTALSPNLASVDPLAGSSEPGQLGLGSLSFTTPLDGHAILFSSHCSLSNRQSPPAPQAPPTCTTSTREIHTADGGATWSGGA